ncbi:MAG TPA: type II toxin-antitoxin system HicB family antitoxin [Bryobacterales bacterium]|nr:type II toxin-antitoxin system HicB family antitoxin [Bryobacterales bacterium]
MRPGSMRYAVIIEKTETGYSAYPPDLPGCGVSGPSLKEVERLIREAIEFHIEGLQRHGQAVPEPTSICEYVDAAVSQPG